MRKFILITLVTLFGTIFQAEGKVEDYIMPSDHPLQKKLSGLFKQITFESRNAARDGGFIPIKRAHRGLMVMSHPDVEGVLFKKFMDDKCSPEEELNSFISRIEGARRLQALIKEKKLKHIVVPEKWLFPLDEGGRYILVVQKIDILSSNLTKEKYGKMAPQMLSELCLVLNRLRGLDSVIPNMPFTKQNKIAFIDTERWEQNRPRFLHHAMKYLSPKNQKYAESLKDF